MEIQLANEAYFIIQITTVLITSVITRRLGSQAMVSWLCLQSILANLLVLKMIYLFGLEVTGSDAFMIGSLYTLNLIREDHGATEAKKAVMTSLLLMASTAGIFSIHCAFQSVASDQIAPVYHTLLSGVIPVMGWSGIIFLLAQVIDYSLFSMLKRIMPNHQLAWRLFLSIAITQVADTALFTYWALDGWCSQFWDVLFWGYAIKVVITVVLSMGASIRKHSQQRPGDENQYVQI